MKSGCTNIDSSFQTAYFHKKLKIINTAVMLHVSQCSNVPAWMCVCEVNGAALYCDNSNDHHSTKTHLGALDHRVKR